MIKNLLYSLFIHFLLGAIIYANFNLKEPEESKSNEFSVSLVSFNGSENSGQIKTTNSVSEKIESKKELQKPLPKKPKSPIKSQKNIVQEQSKELAKSKPSQSINKPTEDLTQEFRPQEEVREKQEETKNKLDELVNDKKDDQKNDSFQKEKDLGAKETSDLEQEASNNKSSADNSSENLSSSIDSIDLSAREKFNIQSQLNQCYRRAIDETKLNSKMKITVKVEVSEDGYIDSNLEDTIDATSYNNPRDSSYKIAIDNIRRAIDLCSPLRNLPLDKYDAWKEVILEFDENELI